LCSSNANGKHIQVKEKQNLCLFVAEILKWVGGNRLGMEGKGHHPDLGKNPQIKIETG